MRIHSDTLTRQNFTDAARKAGVGIVDLSEHGSQSRARAFNFTLSGSGRNGGQWGAQDYKTATWDEWGIFLAHLFQVDESARVAQVYESAEHFHWVTGDRFRALTPAYQHKRHKWDAHGHSATGSYYVHQCDCGAVSRNMAYGHKWEEISA